MSLHLHRNSGHKAIFEEIEAIVTKTLERSPHSTQSFATKIVQTLHSLRVHFIHKLSLLFILFTIWVRYKILSIKKGVKINFHTFYYKRLRYNL